MVDTRSRQWRYAADEDMPVYFYSTREKPYGCFSNFSRHGFDLEDLWWPTSEHYFQAHKYWGTPHAELIRKAPSAGEAARLGRGRKLPLRPDWDAVKENVMQQGVLRKFASHPDIRAVLLSTGDDLIVESSPKDGYWGRGADGNGQNRLGHILMAVRTTLRSRGDNRTT